jgi:hypothetical protein
MTRYTKFTVWSPMFCGPALRTQFLLLAMLVVSGMSCWADTTWADSMDPLHGFCSGSLQCVDNGTNSPTTNNPPTSFGFTVSPGPASGDLLLELLIPNNLDASPSSLSFDLDGTLIGTATLFSSTPWTSGFLDTYLGISASPSNPIGAYLGPCGSTTPCTGDVDPGATGFFLYQVSFTGVTLQGASNPNISPLENFTASDPSLPIGSFINGFLNEGTSSSPQWIATANSGAIFADVQPGVGPRGIVPEPSSIVLVGSVALLCLAILLKRRAIN